MIFPRFVIPKRSLWFRSKDCRFCMNLRYLISERYSSTAIKTLCLFLWFSRKYYASVMNIKEFFADNLGKEFIGIIADAFLKQ